MQTLNWNDAENGQKSCEIFASKNSQLEIFESVKNVSEKFY